MWDIKYANENDRADLIQKTAWRLVRSAEDRFGGNGTGQQKLDWATDRLQAMFKGDVRDQLQDYVRAAFVNFRAEQKAAF